MILPLPYRNWCPHCVNGRAKNEPHRRIEDREEESIPVIAIDYMYMISERDEKGQERTIRGMPILVIKDTSTGYLAAAVVPKKGECGYACKFLVNVL